MRLGRRVVVTAVVGCVLTAGCAAPEGIDGKLADDWAPMPSPSQFVPKAGVCHLSPPGDTGPLASYEPAPCAGPHRTETFHVGAFPPATLVGLTAPPTRVSLARRAAFAICDQQARAFLGRDFRYGRLGLNVVSPSSPAWAGGARWFRCDLGELAAVDDPGTLVERTGSLAGALKTVGSPLDLACFQVTATATGAIGTMTAISCSVAHNSEFTGTFTAGSATRYPVAAADWERMHAQCRSVVADFTGVRNDATFRFRTGTIAAPAPQEEWDGGDRGIRCYLYVNAGSFSRSLRGAGPTALPER
ncbi:septum formation family protein [Pilimelia columellifera]|uniref:Septum formation-related domain-containing protein n=1 Tax=Pilimelia columellifera subsp. columellifera TaxID=706583 RepID=A0ABP6AMV2_9ACTN